MITDNTIHRFKTLKRILKRLYNVHLINHFKYLKLF